MGENTHAETRDGLLSLISKVEHAQAGSDELDRAVAKVCGIEWSTDEEGNYGPYNITPSRIRFSRSLDAADVLIFRTMEALGVRLYTVQTDARLDSRGPSCKAEVTVASREFQGYAMGLDCMARAWCAAALRTKASYPQPGKVSA